MGYYQQSLRQTKQPLKGLLAGNREPKRTFRRLYKKPSLYLEAASTTFGGRRCRGSFWGTRSNALDQPDEEGGAAKGGHYKGRGEGLHKYCEKELRPS